MTNTLTFTDWENYTDDDSTAFTLDWTDANALVGKFAFPYLEALRQAFNERTALWHDPFPAFPTGSPWLRRWAGYLLQAITEFLRGEYSTMNYPDVGHTPWYVMPGGVHFPGGMSLWTGGVWWINPSILPTLHNVVLWENDIYSEMAQTMIDASYIGVARDTFLWDAVLNRFMDDAGVTDITFRDWMTTDFQVLYDDYTGAVVSAWAPMSSMIWNLKQMLSLLDTAVAYIPFPTTSLPTSQPWGSSYLRVTKGTRERRIGSGATWSDAVTSFNSATWTVPLSWLYWTEEKSYCRISHTGGPDLWSITRSKRTDSFIIPTIANAHVEISELIYLADQWGLGLGLNPDSTNLLRPNLDTNGDFSGITRISTTGDLPSDPGFSRQVLHVQTSVNTSGSTENVAFGAFDTAGTGISGYGNFGWVGQHYVLRFDFSGAYFGGNGFIFHN